MTLSLDKKYNWLSGPFLEKRLINQVAVFCCGMLLEYDFFTTIAQYAGEGGMFSLGVTTCVVSLKIVGNLDDRKDIGVVVEILKWLGGRKVRCIKILLYILGAFVC